MIVLADSNPPYGLWVLVFVGVVFVGICFILFYHFVISRRRTKKVIRELEKICLFRCVINRSRFAVHPSS